MELTYQMNVKTVSVIAVACTQQHIPKTPNSNKTSLTFHIFYTVVKHFCHTEVTLSEQNLLNPIAILIQLILIKTLNGRYSNVSVCMLQVAITTPSISTPFHKLWARRKVVARALAGGHAKSIASTVMKIPDVKKELHRHILNSINRACTELCKKDTIFCSIPADQIANLDGRSS